MTKPRASHGLLRKLHTVQAAALLPTCCVLHYIGGSFRFHSFRIHAMTELNNSNPRQLLLLQEVQRRSAATVEELAAFLG